MKILFFTHSLSHGGAERVTATLANHWASKKFLVTVVTVAGKAKDFYTLDDRIERLALDLEANSANPWCAFINNARRVSALRSILRRDKPDVAVAMMTTANATLALAGWGLAVPTIGSERTYPPAMPLGRAWEMLRRWSYPLLSGLVAQTAQSAEWLRVNAPAPQIVVIPNPINYPLQAQEPKVLPSSVLNEVGSSHLLLAVGRLGEEKQFDRLIRAFSTVSQRYPDWALVILGEGNERKALAEQIDLLKISHRVRLPGAVGNVGEWLEAADIYSLTSRFEGFPNTLVEALAYGVPSVAVNCETGPREILRNELDGFLVPQDDEQALIQALDSLMSNRSLRLSFGKYAVEARERFAVDVVAREWEAFFAKVSRSVTSTLAD